MELDSSLRTSRLYSTLVKSGQIRPFAMKKLLKQQPTVIKHASPDDLFKDNYGDRDLIQSTVVNDKTFTRLGEVNGSLINQQVWIRARVHSNRIKGKGGFLILRDQLFTAQATLFQGENASPQMMKYAIGIPLESIVDIYGNLKTPDQPIQSSTQTEVEIEVLKLYVISRSETVLPFQIEDANEPMSLEEAENEGTAKESSGDKKRAKVTQNIRLNNRIIDLRVPVNQALARISSGVCRFFRNYLTNNQFVEIHTPKLLGGTSEGGANVFRLKYFGKDACLAQSPQLFKQMAIMGDLQRVFEIGPVFRAEDSNTHRHLCEFTGLDLEMAINEHYIEAMDIIHGLFLEIFTGLQREYQIELEVVRQHFPFIQPFQFTQEPLYLTFAEGVQMLKDAGITQGEFEDLSTPNEKALGALVKEKYNTDFYILHKYPADARPFYSMLNKEDPRYTCSYDVFMRGEEIISGAQRIHDPDILARRARDFGIPVETIQDYIKSFRYGAFPHAGCGIGLERVVMLFCGLKNIRWTSMFPRDPKRLAP